LNTSIYLKDCYQINYKSNVNKFYRRQFNHFRSILKNDHFTKDQAINALMQNYKRLNNALEFFRLMYNWGYITPVKFPLINNFLSDKNQLSVYAQRFSFCPSEFNLMNFCYSRLVCCNCSEKTDIVNRVFTKIFKNATILESYEVKFNYAKEGK
jgi:hypothetical protein